jgi:hypothetical protein
MFHRRPDIFYSSLFSFIAGLQKRKARLLLMIAGLLSFITGVYLL